MSVQRQAPARYTRGDAVVALAHDSTDAGSPMISDECLSDRRDECLSDRRIDKLFVRTLAKLLEETFGVRFDLWLPGDEWTPLQSRGPAEDAAPPAHLRQLLDQACQSGRSAVCAQLAGDTWLAIPVWRKRELALVATAKPRCPPAAVAPLAAAFMRELGLREELESQRAANEVYAIEMTRSFEELFLLRQLAQYLDLSDVSNASNDLADATMSLLRQVMASESVLWIASQDQDGKPSEPGEVAVGDVVTADGDVQFDFSLVRSLIERYRGLASIQPVVKNRLEDSAEGLELPGVHEFALVTVAAGGRHRGWILAINRSRSDGCWANAGDSGLTYQEFGTVEAGLMSTVASILAAHARNVELFREKEDTLLGAVRSLVSAIEAKDRYTRGHSERVGLFARRIGETLGLDRATCRQLYLSGLLHDVGKIAIQGATLRKPGRLTDEEFSEIQQHSQAGWEILYELDRLQNVLPAVVHHHERYDGAGYPDGLAGEEIPEAARILAVADTYDALTSDRPYRQGMAQEKAEAILREGAGTQWDPQVIEAMLSAMPDIIRIRQEYQPRRPPQRKPSHAGHGDPPGGAPAPALATDALLTTDLGAASVL